MTRTKTDGVTRVGARVAALLASAALIVAACGGGASTAPSSGRSTEPSASAPAGEAYTVNVVEGATLGAYLTGEGGKTLYVFKNDSPDTSTCSGGCADHWPAFALEGAETVVGGTGITGTFGTITGADGKSQVTYDHAPLYYFAGDTAAGQTNGQGASNGAWVVAPASGTTGGASPTPKQTKPGY